MILSKKALYKFYGVSINSHEFMKLQNLESGMSDVMMGMQKYFIPDFLCIFLLILWKKPFTQFYGRFDHFS